MAATKFDVEKFTRSNDFALWIIKMKALLAQQSLVEALDGESSLPKGIIEDKKQTMLKKAHSALILCLGD